MTVDENMRSAVAFGWRPAEFGAAGYGERLVEAVAAWQRERLLPVTGYVDERTFRALVVFRKGIEAGARRQEIDAGSRCGVGIHAHHPAIVATEPLAGLVVYDPQGTNAGFAAAASAWHAGRRAVFVAPPAPCVVNAMAQRQRGAWCVLAHDPGDVHAALSGPAAARVVAVAMRTTTIADADPQRPDVLLGACDLQLPRVSIPDSDLLTSQTFKQFRSYHEHFEAVMPLVELGRRDSPQETMAAIYKWWPLTMGSVDGKLKRVGRKITFPIWSSPFVAKEIIWRWRDECLRNGLRAYGYSIDVYLEHDRDVLTGTDPCPGIQVDTPHVDRLFGRR